MQLYTTEQNIPYRAAQDVLSLGEKKKKDHISFTNKFLLLVCSVVVCSLGSFPVFCKGDVYFIKMTVARQQIGSLSGNWDEVEPCRGIYKQQGFLRGREGTESQKCIT